MCPRWRLRNGTHELMANKAILALLLPVLCGCQPNDQRAGDAGTYSAMPPQCDRSDNGADRPCRLSAIELVATPGRWSGMYVEVMLYYPERSTRLMFATRDAAVYEDYASSILLVGSWPRQWLPQADRFVRVTGKFRFDRSDHGVGWGSTSQAGTIQPTRMIPATRFEERVRHCPSCRYLDGATPPAE